MPSSLTHRQQARHNEEFIAFFDLDSTPYLDWVVTAIFYAALHLVDSYLATKGVHLSSHRGRDSLIWTVRDLRPIYSAYRRLKHRSEQARYDAVPFSNKQVRELLDRDLASIKVHLAGLS
jgi:uncharacterized protein (UPF0332 family)